MLLDSKEDSTDDLYVSSPAFVPDTKVHSSMKLYETSWLLPVALGGRCSSRVSRKRVSGRSTNPF